MSQANVTTANETAFIAEETTYGSSTPPTMAAMILEADTFEPAAKQEELDNLDASARLADEQDPVLGVKSEGSGCKFSLGVRPHASQITGAAPGTEPYLHILLRCLLGGQQVGAGSAISAGAADGSTVTVASAAGFAVGQPVAAINTGNSTIEHAVITGIAGTVVSLWPYLSAQCSAGTLVNSYAGFWTETNAKSLIVQHALASNSNEQHQFVGCTGKFGLKIERNKLMMLEADLKAASWTRGALGLSTAVQTQTMGAARWAVKDALLYLQAPATTTRVHYTPETFEVTTESGMVHVPGHGNTENTVGVMRTAGRGLHKIKARFRADTDLRTYWTSRTELRLLYAIPQGSGTAKRFGVVYAPKVIVVGSPSSVKEGGRLLYEVELVTKIDNTQAANSLAGAPLVVATI